MRRLALRLGGTGRIVNPPALAADTVADARAALDAYATTGAVESDRRAEAS
jgi:hypothetical protein